MKITKLQLKQLIKEELTQVFSEQEDWESARHDDRLAAAGHLGRTDPGPDTVGRKFGRRLEDKLDQVLEAVNQLLARS